MKSKVSKFSKTHPGVDEDKVLRLAVRPMRESQTGQVKRFL